MLKIYVKKNMFKTVLLILFINSLPFIICAQDTTLVNFYQTSGLNNVASTLNGSGNWLKFHNGVAFNQNSFFDTYKNQLGGSNDENMVLVKHTVSDVDIYRYKKYYKNIPVEFSTVVLHVKNGILKYLSGSMKDDIDLSASPSLTAQQAKDAVFQQYEVDTALVENAGCYAKAKTRLAILPKSITKSNVAHLVYCVTAAINKPNRNGTTYIDANNGKLIYYNSSEYFDGVPTVSSVYTLYNNPSVPKQINTATGTIEGHNYSTPCLADLTRGSDGSGIFTRPFGYTYYLQNKITNNYPAPGTWYTEQTFPTQFEIDNGALDLHWGLGKAYDFYFNSFGRKSFDNGEMYHDFYPNGYPIVANITNANNNWWSNGSLDFCFGLASGASFGPITCLDVVGHEYTHAVKTAIHWDANAGIDLYNNSFEAGALNESFSDIFGEVIDINTNGMGNWFVGDCNNSPQKRIRSLQNPRNYGTHFEYSPPPSLMKTDGDPAWCVVTEFDGQPDTYGDNYWAPEGNPDEYPQTCNWIHDVMGYTYRNDGEIIHTNSGVPNHWFYLLASGGSGFNYWGLQYCLNGVNATTDIEKVNKAAGIVYKTMSELTDYPNFRDARTGSEVAATELFGFRSDEHLQVALAWDAVNVIPVYSVNFNYDIGAGSYYGVSGLLPDQTLVTAFNNISTSPLFQTTTIESNSDVWFSAAGSVKLQQGFHAQSGAKFLASIRPQCNTSKAGGINAGSPTTSDPLHAASEKSVNPVNKSVINMNLAPNPATNRLTVLINGHGVEPYKLEIINLVTGNVLQVIQATENELQIDISQLPVGVYSVRAVFTNEMIVKKLVKQ